MFDGGTYLRGLWKQKPKQWGPESTVLAIVIDRVGHIFGVKPTHVWPFWSDTGSFRDIITGSVSESSPNNWGYDGAIFRKAIAPYGVNSGVSNDLSTVFSIFLLMAPVLEAATNGVYMSAGSTGADEWMFRRGATYGAYNFYGAAGGMALSGSTGVDDGSTVPVVLDRDSSELRLFLNGDYKNRDITTSQLLTTKDIQFGGADSNSARAGSCNIKFCCIFDQPLSNSYEDFDLVKVMSEDPYALIQPPTFRTYFIPSGDGLPTINCNAGTLVNTGIVADISNTHNINCSSGAINCQGIGATITKEKDITCTTGTIEAHGNAATIIKEHTVQTGTGTITATGVMAEITNEDSINCTTGELIFTGTKSFVSHTMQIICNTGVVVLTGVNAIVRTGERSEVKIDPLIMGYDGDLNITVGHTTLTIT